MNIPYDGSTAMRDINDFAPNEQVMLELGPTTNSGVTLTIQSADSVIDVETWRGSAKTFTAPNQDPLEVTMNNAAGAKKIYLTVKPHGGLPGGKPV